MPRVSSSASGAVAAAASLNNSNSTNNHNNKIEKNKTESNECKVVPNVVFLKIRGNDKTYQEALEASSKFNKRLCSERKMRIPFIDSQTRVAQTNCMMWLYEYQRITKDCKKSSSHVYEYPCKKWYKHRRHLFDSSNSEHQQYLQQQQANNPCGLNGNGQHLGENGTNGMSHLLNENSNSMDSTSLNANNQQLVKQTSNSNDDYEPMNVGGGGLTNKHHHLAHDEWSHHDDSFENFDMNEDNYNDSDDVDYDEPNKKKKKGKGAGKGAGSGGGLAGGKKGKETLNPDDKPFVCDKCGMKYKTKPGLTYHIQKSHGSNSNLVHQQSTANHSSTNQHHQDENTTNSMFGESGYDDVNSSSSLPTNTNNNVKKCGLCGDSELRQFTIAPIVANNPTPTPNQVEKFIACFECNKSFHPACLNFNNIMVQNVRKYSWLCVECKKCTICGTSENDDKLLFCDDCDRGYHMYCLKPQLSEAPAGDWRCELCVNNKS